MISRVVKAGLILILAICSTALAMTKGSTGDANLRSLNKPTAGAPSTQNCSHRVGNVLFTITNWGFFGSQFQQGQLTELYCLGPGITRGELAPSFEYPAGTGVNYLFQGALWLGAIVGEDTLVSVGADGWQIINEMYPDEAPNGSIVQLSNRKSSPYYSSDAVSEQDFVAEYFDTLTDQAYVGQDPFDNRPHMPLNVKVLQRSYSWSYSYAEDFVLLDYKLVNMGLNDIRKAYMALYVDADNWHATTSNGFADDISGYKTTVPSPACKTLQDSINIAWTADADGDPDIKTGAFTSTSTIAVSGTRVIRSPNPELQFSFNWWVSNGDAALDWGPRRVENNRDFGTGGLGTPEGDKNKYYIMSKREFDYDQLFTAVDQTLDGWLPPPSNATTLAKGYDTRYLFSFGPFDIAPGDTVPFTIGYIGGERFHVKPDDYAKHFKPETPQEFYGLLDFSDFATNALWAGWVYDNPGADTDGNGYRGEFSINPCTEDTLWTGDGKPDFAGPPPPPPPLLRFSASPGEVSIRWNGKTTEESEDPFSFEKDFEGYRVYLGSKLQLNEFALLTSYDHEDFDRLKLNQDYSPARWELIEVPFTLDSLKKLYGETFEPEDYPSASDSMTWIETVEGETDTNYYYFRKQDYNRDELSGSGAIRKLYPDSLPGSMVWDEQLQDSVDAYYEYGYDIEGLLPSLPVYIAVAAFDFGNPATNLGPLESSPLANAIEVYPVYSADEAQRRELKVTVFPNPYKVNGGYAEARYEDIAAALSPLYARRVHFANLPSEAKVKIYTLDGDLVRELEHPCNCPLQEGESMMAWDLISKNTQAAVAGIYLYTVESEFGTQVGKFVLIL